MKKFYILAVSVLLGLSASAQTVINFDLGTVSTDYTTTFETETVLDVHTTASAIASPLVSMTNPFKDLDFDQASISFDVYNYGNLAVLGALFGFYDATYGRIYFSNGGYLGYNDTGLAAGAGLEHFFDANMVSFGMGTDFLGQNAWKNVEIKFNASGYTVTVDGTLAFETTSTDITITTERITDYSEVITYLKNAATFAFGTGSWWSDNTNPEDGSYYDAQNSYMKNLKFTYSTSTAVHSTGLTAEVVSVEYINISGASAGADYNALSTGIYIKKEVYSNGAVNSTKIVK